MRGIFLFHVETFSSIRKMLFNNYLETLLGSKVKVKILRALFRFHTKTFTSRELASNIKVSHTAVLKSLGDLQGMNIIKIERHGTSNLITLNKDSHLIADLSILFSSETETFQHLKDELRKALPQAKSIAIFGSVATRKEKLNSDIDVLIITSDKDKTSDMIAKKQEEFSKKFGNVISAYIMTESEFSRKRKTDLVKSMLENRILVKGEEL